MSDPVKRARVQLPTIQITMVSIIVALALQQWLDRLPVVDATWEPTPVAARVWCQALTAIVIIGVAGSLYLIAQAVSAIGPIVAWRVLRRLGDRK